MRVRVRVRLRLRVRIRVRVRIGLEGYLPCDLSVGDHALDSGRLTALRALAEGVPRPQQQLRRRRALGDDLREGVASVEPGQG